MNWNLRTNTRLLILVTSGISAATGAGVSYVVANKLLEKKFQERLAIEIKNAKATYQQMYSQPTLVAEDPSDTEERLLEGVRKATDEYDGPPRDLVGDALSAMNKYNPEDRDDDSVPPPPVVQVTNIFTDHTPPGAEVLDVLMKDRDPSEPYIITKEEFLENAPDFEQKRFTFYEGDGILVDDQDEFNPIMDTERVAGDDNLLRFGYGSQDEYVVYIRNETLDPPIDLHITRSAGKYAVEVMSFDDDEPFIRHSQPRKFRTRDE